VLVAGRLQSEPDLALSAPKPRSFGIGAAAPPVMLLEGHFGLEPVSVDIRTGLSTATGNSAGKRFSEARDRDGIFRGTGRFRATETDAIRVSAGKAAESQRLFRRRQETEVAQECVVELGGLELATERLCGVLHDRFAKGTFSPRVLAFDAVATTRPVHRTGGRRQPRAVVDRRRRP
jgi:hypothetical protein